MCRCVLGAVRAKPCVGGQRSSATAAAASVTVTQTTSQQVDKAQQLKVVSSIILSLRLNVSTCVAQVHHGMLSPVCVLLCMYVSCRPYSSVQ